MSQPTSLRLPDLVRERLARAAARQNEKPAAAAVRLIDEGIRMADHPGVVFHDSPTHGRVATIAGGPDVAEIIAVLGGLEARSEQRVEQTAAWLGVHSGRVRVALDYYTQHREEIDGQIERRARESDELRHRYEMQQALLE